MLLPWSPPIPLSRQQSPLAPGPHCWHSPALRAHSGMREAAELVPCSAEGKNAAVRAACLLLSSLYIHQSPPARIARVPEPRFVWDGVLLPGLSLLGGNLPFVSCCIFTEEQRFMSPGLCPAWWLFWVVQGLCGDCKAVRRVCSQEPEVWLCRV